MQTGNLMADNDKTVSKTLWSETLIEMLLMALRKNRPDAEIKGMIKELHDKGYKNNYILEKVNKELGDIIARRVRILVK